MTSSDWIEAETLILNPTIADDVLLALYRGDKFCEGMDEDRRRQLVSMSGRNERLHTRNDDEHGPDMDALFRRWRHRIEELTSGNEG